MNSKAYATFLSHYWLIIGQKNEMNLSFESLNTFNLMNISMDKYSKRLILNNLIKKYTGSIKKVTADEDDPVSHTITQGDVTSFLKFSEEYFRYFLGSEKPPKELITKHTKNYYKFQQLSFNEF